MRIDGVDVVNVDLGLGNYPDDRMAGAAADISARFASMPGVAAVGAARMVPLEGGGLGLGALRRAGDTAPESNIDTDWNTVITGFLPALENRAGARPSVHRRGSARRAGRRHRQRVHGASRLAETKIRSARFSKTATSGPARPSRCDG
jgi:hypothetical protein